MQLFNWTEGYPSSFIKKFKWKYPIRFKALLGIVLFLFGIIPLFIQSQILVSSFRIKQIEDRMVEVQNQCLMISNKLTASGYMVNQADNSVMTNEMQLMADIYNGRIIAVDSSFQVVMDSFGLSAGRYQISEDVIRCFLGESKSKYENDKHYFAITIPVYSNSSNQEISGVLMMTASTENILTQSEALTDRAYMFHLLIGAVIVVFCILTSQVLMKPFHRLRQVLGKVATGNLEEDIEVETYRETQDISASVSQTLTKLKAVDQSREEFVSNVSHELKTPITSIRVLADSLMGMDEVPVELYREFMTDISDEIDRESKIIDDLLALVKMDKSATELNIAPVSINALMELILKRLRPIAKKRNVELIFESIREVTADIDEVKMSLALNNLVENAIKYNMEDGWVRVTLDADHKFFYVKVADSGVGIPDEFQELVFERFYRVDKARSRETGGTGLGLAITKSVILMHQGALKLQSKEKEGTVFTVRVPLNYIP